MKKPISKIYQAYIKGKHSAIPLLSISRDSGPVLNSLSYVLIELRDLKQSFNHDMITCLHQKIDFYDTLLTERWNALRNRLSQ